MKSKKYTIEQVNEILETQGFHCCTCNNEKNGKTCFGIDTIQVALEEDCDYFGEFVGNEKIGYIFKFYVK
jgi:hypothetical protein